MQLLQKAFTVWWSLSPQSPSWWLSQGGWWLIKFHVSMPITLHKALCYAWHKWKRRTKVALNSFELPVWQVIRDRGKDKGVWSWKLAFTNLQIRQPAPQWISWGHGPTGWQSCSSNYTMTSFLLSIKARTCIWSHLQAFTDEHSDWVWSRTAALFTQECKAYKASVCCLNAAFARNTPELPWKIYNHK